MPPPSRSMAASDSRSLVAGAATTSTPGKTPSSWRPASETTRSGRWPGTRARGPELPTQRASVARASSPLGGRRLMIGRLILAVLALVVALPAWARAEPINLKMLSNYSRATFKTDAPLETVVGNTAGPAVTGNLTVDPLKPATATGTIKVDLTTLNTCIATG